MHVKICIHLIVVFTPLPFQNVLILIIHCLDKKNPQITYEHKLIRCNNYYNNKYTLFHS